eukprot:gene12577-16865_t
MMRFLRAPIKAPFNSIKTRLMSGGHEGEHALEETQRWMKLTAVMGVLSLAFHLYAFSGHHPHSGKEGLPYQRFRTKPFPWKCSDCSLFDAACWKECKAALKGEKSEGHGHH